MDTLNFSGRLIDTLLPVLILAGCVLIVSALLRGLQALSGPPAPVAKPFMTRRERAVLAALEQVLPMYRIHAQVAMGALLKASASAGRRSNPADRNAFSQKIVDFVVEDPTTGKVVALVEVDDHTHSRAKDRLRDAMTAKAGYRTVRIPPSARPSAADMLAAVGHLRGVVSNSHA
ncbi:MAG: DUF2726 domain-containing protein [Sphingobium sp.]|uniref:DUF2726 domain-containing protein n=1 Tax=Sphingobium sp. TaxID=1912891 RepID=UPI0029AA7E4B|nr:DUF2726 domain-containing protein [Sphingobium sp.]MDX3910963.1 DUF2726 domain-containing protein [Sphingobium sp.]